MFPGKSFNSILFSDAGLDYFYKDDPESGSIGLDIESILIQFGNTDFWFGCDAGSYDELAEKTKIYVAEIGENRQVLITETEQLLRAETIILKAPLPIPIWFCRI